MLQNLTPSQGRLGTAFSSRVCADAFFVGIFLLLATIIALPGLGERLITHSDNPAHIAEIRDLARVDSNGWSDLAYAGFPLHILQPPAIFGALSNLTRLGFPLERLYEFSCILGLAAPAAAVFLLARVRLSAFWAFALASTVLFYRGSLYALDGMFSFGLASAALVLTLGLLVRPTRNLQHTALLAALVAFIGLAHMYVTIALVYLAFVHAMFSIRQPDERSRLRYDVPAFLLGMIAAAAYWLPNVLSGTRPPNPFSGMPISGLVLEALKKVVSRLVTVSAPVDPTMGRWGQVTSDPIFYMDIFLQVFVLLAVVAGISKMVRSRDAAPRYGAALGLMIVGLMFAQAVIPVPFLGPQAERLLYVAKLGFAIAAIPGFQLLAQKLSGSVVYRIMVGALLLAHVWMFNRLEEHQITKLRSSDIVDLERTWAWLSERKHPGWGRLYIQNTSGVRDLSSSHILTRTAEVTGVEQIGNFYGHTPYDRPEYWDPMIPTDPQTVDRVLAVMDRANATHLLLVDPALSDLFARDNRLKMLVQHGRYIIFERVGKGSQWSDVVEGAGEVATMRVAPGRIRLNIEGSVAKIVVKESFHPFWRVAPPNAATLESGPAGAMIASLPRQQSASTIELLYAPPVLPFWLSVAGWLMILGLLIKSAFGTAGRGCKTA